jgi:hypothetical protein
VLSTSATGDSINGWGRYFAGPQVALAVGSADSDPEFLE